jgi:hypothetical protein
MPERFTGRAERGFSLLSLLLLSLRGLSSLRKRLFVFSLGLGVPSLSSVRARLGRADPERSSSLGRLLPL